MVSNAAQFIKEAASSAAVMFMTPLDWQAVIQINDTQSHNVIPELIRILTEKYDISFEESVTIVSFTSCIHKSYNFWQKLWEMALNLSRKYLQRLLWISKAWRTHCSTVAADPSVQVIIDKKVLPWLTPSTITALSMVLQRFILRFWRDRARHSFWFVPREILNKN